MSEYRTDEAFAIVPLWLAESDVSDRALRLYALLSGMRDYGTDMATVGRKRLAKLLRCSEDSLDRAKTELEKCGAITVQRGERQEGLIPRNVYVIHRTRAGSRTSAGSPAGTRTGAAMYERPQDKSTTTTAGAREASQLDLAGGATALAPSEKLEPKEVAGVKVTNVERQFALAILAAFNAAFETKFHGVYYLRGVIGRIREHPELTLVEHVDIIGRAQANPWWKDDPSPAVIYGNDGVFERALNAKAKPAGPDLTVYDG